MIQRAIRYRFPKLRNHCSLLKICIIKFFPIAKKIRKNLKFALFFLILFFIEISYPNQIRLFSVSHSLFFILIFFLSLYRERYVLLIGLSLGLIKDIFSISKLPLNTVVYGLWSYLLPKIFKRFYKENIFLQISIFIFCVWINSAIFFISKRRVSFSIFSTIASLESLYGVIMYLFLSKFLKGYLIRNAS